MPTVRRGERQVGTAALPGVRATAAETALSQGAGVEQARADKYLAFGHAIGETARHIGTSVYREVVDAERKAANQTALLEANNRLSEWTNKRLYDPEGGAFNVKGKAAMPLPEQLRDEYDQLASQIEAGLGNDEQRAAFANLRSQSWQSIDLQVRRHVAGEIQQFRAGELKATVGNSVNAAIRSANDPGLVAAELQKAVSAIRTTAPALGQGPEEIEASVRAVQTQAHVGVISQLLAEEKADQASAYFEAVQGQIDGEQLDNVKKALEEGSLRKQAQGKADEILTAGGTLTEQREKAKQIDNPALRDQVMQRLEHEANVRDRERRETEEKEMKQGFDLLDQNPDVSKIPPTLWSSYSGATRSSMMAYARAKAKGEPLETDDPTYYSLMLKAGDSPEQFASTNLLQYRGKLDDGDFKQLVSLQLSIKSGNRKAADDTLADFRTKSQLIEDTLALHGIDPSAKPDTAEGKAIAQLRRMVDRRVALLQGGGKKATNEDIQGEIDALLSRSQTVEGSWWALARPFTYDIADKTKRLIDLTINDIPATDRAQIEAALRQFNRPVSDATVLDLYIENQIRRGQK